MKKIIQVLSVLSLLVVFSCVSAKAQTVEQFAAKIPFNFNIGQKSFEAGDYVIKVAKHPAGAITLSLEDSERNNLQTVLVQRNGDVGKDKPQLIFARSVNRRYLSGMFMPNMELSISASNGKEEIRAAKGSPAVDNQGIAVAAMK